MSLMLAYKLIIGISPHGDQIFEPLNSDLSAVSVAGSTRRQTQLQEHPIPIRIRKDPLFKAALDSFNWRNLPFVVEALGQYVGSL